MTDATPTKRIDIRASVLLVVLALVLCAVMAGSASLFMSFHGLRDLVIRVEGVTGWLSNVGPIGIDGLQLATLFAIVFTVGAPARVRVYLWIVFFGAIAVSVVGNMLDASARGVDASGVWLSAFWPVLLAAATHVVVVAIRWWNDSRATATAEVVATAGEQMTESSVDEPEPDAGAVDKPSPTRAQLQAWARARYRNVKSSRKVAEAMQANGHPVSMKDVERWTRDLRAAVASDEPAEVTV